MEIANFIFCFSSRLFSCMLFFHFCQILFICAYADRRLPAPKSIYRNIDNNSNRHTTSQHTAQKQTHNISFSFTNKQFIYRKFHIRCLCIRVRALVSFDFSNQQFDFIETSNAIQVHRYIQRINSRSRSFVSVSLLL